MVGEVCRDCTGCSYADAELRDSLGEMVSVMPIESMVS